ncbi:transcriptional regulator, AraC family domain protein [Burkholderia pseudomallei]|nr:transcriptional regulator, AraC family domain protein [Burkholderia pseudomallei]
MSLVIHINCYVGGRDWRCVPGRRLADGAPLLETTRVSINPRVRKGPLRNRDQSNPIAFKHIARECDRTRAGRSGASAPRVARRKPGRTGPAPLPAHNGVSAGRRPFEERACTVSPITAAPTTASKRSVSIPIVRFRVTRMTSSASA